MPMRRATLLIILLGVAVLVHLCLSATQTEQLAELRRPASSPAASSAELGLPEAVSSAGKVSGDLVYGWQPGTVLRHQFHYRQTTRLTRSKRFREQMAGAKISMPSFQEQGVSLSLGGKLTMTIYATLESDYLIGYRFSDLVLNYSTDKQKPSADKFDSFARQMHVELLGRVSALGEIWELRLPDSLQPEAASQLLAVIGAVRVVLPGAAQPRWQVPEEDHLGLYQAQYQAKLADGQDLVEITRTKDYHEIYGAGGKPIEAKAISGGKIRAQFSRANGLLVSLEGNETLQVKGRQFPMDVNSLLRIRLRLQRADAAQVDAAGARKRYESRQPHEGTTPVDAARVARRTLKKLTDKPLEKLASVLSELEIALASKASGSQRNALFLRLVKSLEQDAPGLRRIADRLKEGQIDGTLGYTLLDALGRLGTPAAQQALLDVLDSSATTLSIRATAVLALTSVKAPRSDIVQRLASHAVPGEPLSGAVLEALGITAGRALLRGDQRLAKQAVSFLEKSYARDASPQWKRAVILGLGNAGEPGTFELIAAGADDEHAIVRAATAVALRKMPRQRALPLLTRLALKDPVARVQESAAQAMEQLR